MQEINYESLLVLLTYCVERRNVTEERLDVAHTIILTAYFLSHLQTAVVSVVTDVIACALAYLAWMSSLL